MNQEAAAAPGRKLWRVGTLSYTAGGLLMLCLCLLGGDFPWALKDRAVAPSATLLIRQIGVSELVYGLVIIGFPNFTNLFLSPAICYISDRHRGRWGRRIPFLMFTTPFIVLGLYLLGFSRMLGSRLHGAVPAVSEHAGMLFFFCAAWVLLDFGTTLSGSLFNALVNDVVPLELIGRFFGLFRIVSLGAGILYNGWLIDRVKTHAAEIFFGIGTLYLLGLLLLCFKVKEGEYPPPPEEPAPAAGRESVLLRVMRSAVTYLRQSFELPYYRWYMLAVTLGMIVFMPVNFFSIQYAEKLGIDMGKYGLYLVVTYLVSMLLSYPLGAVADRFHPIRCGIVTMAAYFLVMAVGWVLLADARCFGVIFVLHGVLSGCYMTVTASLPSRLVPRALFAQFGSAVGLIVSFCSMVMGPLLGGILDLLDHDYQSLFLLGGVLTLFSILLLFKVYRNFLKQGGDAGYRAPMPE